MDPGAVLLRADTLPEYQNSLSAFRNPNGDIIVVAMNSGLAPLNFTVSIGVDAAISELLPAQSFNTFVVRN